MTTLDLHRESTDIPVTRRKPVATSVPLSHDVPADGVPATVDDRHLDVLVAVSLVEVVTVRTLGLSWLPYVFPGLAVLFAVAGARVAASLDRAEHRPLRVLKEDGWRLLAPLWLLGVVLVPLMLVHQGWVPGQGGGVPLGVRGLLNWLVPLGDPGATRWGRSLVEPLWLVRAELWFLLLSPAFLWMFRRWPRRTAAFPLVVLPLAAFGLLDAGRHPQTSHAELVTLAGFGACWLAGFAFHDGTLARIPWRVAVALWLGGLELAGMRATLGTVPPGVDALVSAAYCLGAVVLLLRLRPSLGWTRRTASLDRTLTLIRGRALTIYAWTSPVAYFAGVIVAAGVLPAWLRVSGVGHDVATFLLSLLLLAVAALSVGRVETLGARLWSRPATAARTGRWGRGVTAFRARPRIAFGGVAMVAAAVLVALLWWRSDGYRPPAPSGQDAYSPGMLGAGVRPGSLPGGSAAAGPRDRATTSRGGAGGPGVGTRAVSDVSWQAAAEQPVGRGAARPSVRPCGCARASTSPAPASPSQRASRSVSAGHTKSRSSGRRQAAVSPPHPSPPAKPQTATHGRALGLGKVKPPPPRRTVPKPVPNGRAWAYGHRVSTGP